MADIQQKMKTGYTVLRVVILSLLLLAAVIWLLMKLLTDEDKKCPASKDYPAAHAFCRVLTQFDTSRSGHISIADLAKALNEGTGGIDDFLNIQHEALGEKFMEGGEANMVGFAAQNPNSVEELSKGLFKQINVADSGRAPIGLLSLAVAAWPDKALRTKIFGGDLLPRFVQRGGMR